MNDFFSKNKTVILAIIILLIAFAAYYFYNKSTSSDASLVASTNNTAAVGAELITLISSLNNINLDKAVFEDQAFKSFIDFTVSIAPQPKGGRNPFSPASFSAQGTTSLQR